MKSIIRDYARLTYALLLLFPIKPLAQETQFPISPDEAKQINGYVPNCPIYAASPKEIEYKKSTTDTTTLKRKTYAIDPKPIDSKMLTGTFIKLADEYILVLKDVEGMFMKDELITDLKDQFNRGSFQSFPLVQEVNSKQLYFISCREYLPTAEVMVERRGLMKSLHKSGYQEHEKEGELFVKTKTAEMKLDTWTFSELKHNPSYISQFDADQLKIAALSYIFSSIC